MKGRPSSAQSEWLKHPNVTWRSAFPLFASLWDSAGMLLAHEGRLLALVAGLLVAVTFGMVLVLGYYDSGGVVYRRVLAGRVWTLAAVALVGVWTSVGRGDWHVRFPLGALVAAWLAVTHVAAAVATGVPLWGGLRELPALGTWTFALSAFGGAWLRSLGRWQLAGPDTDAPPAHLRRFQFSMATLFVLMLLTAAVLGLVQIVAGLEQLWWFAYERFDGADWGAILVASAMAVAAYAIVFGGWRAAAVATILMIVLLTAFDWLNRSTAGLLMPISSTFIEGTVGASVASLLLALVPLVVLRLAGFRRVPTDRPLAGSKPAPGASQD
jgi:hypothetical protein